MARGLQFQRPATPSRHEAGAAWRDLIATALTYARQAADGAALAGDDHVLFCGRIRRVTKMPFPLAHSSAQHATKAFGEAARGFVEAARDEERAALGQMMGDCARGLDRLLAAEAQRSRRIAGEVD